ncbi:MAG: IS21-like element helper ATPase IstB [Ignavibacteria bacterium]
MNNQATIDKLIQLRLQGMVRAFRDTMENGVKHQFTADEMLGHLVDAEWDDRHNRKLNRLLKASKLRYTASFEEIDFSLKRNIDKNLLLRFSDCQWIEKHQNILFTGPTGTGKSFISCALGTQACQHGFKTSYYPASKLFAYLMLCKADGSYLNVLKKIATQDLLIIDDFGLEVLDSQKRLSLLEILEDRYGRKSTIIVSQLPVAKWHDIIGDATIADAICDRLVHSAHQINLKGESARKVYNNRNTEKERIDGNR